MNLEISSTSLRMSGKAWQIRALLGAWSKRPITLKEFLYRQKWKRQQKDEKFGFKGSRADQIN